VNDNQPNPSSSSKKQYSFLYPLAFALVLITGIQLGIFINKASNGKGGTHESSQFQKLNEIMNYVNQKYVDTLNNEQLEEGAIASYLSKLDPHSIYIPAREMESVDEDIKQFKNKHSRGTK
jgi:carboxyl-terminal processing protease